MGLMQGKNFRSRQIRAFSVSVCPNTLKIKFSSFFALMPDCTASFLTVITVLSYTERRCFMVTASRVTYKSAFLFQIILFIDRVPISAIIIDNKGIKGRK